MAPLMDLWAAAVSRARAPGGTGQGLAAVPFENLCRDLAGQGLEIPAGRRTLEFALRQCLLPPLVASGASGVRGRPAARYTFLHLTELVAQPLWRLAARDMERSTSPPWTPKEHKNLQCISEELRGTIVAPEEPLTFDDWLVLFADCLEECVGVKVPLDFVRRAVSSLVPLSFPPTPAAAWVLLGSGVVAPLVGKALASHCRRRCLEKVADLPAPPESSEQLSQGIKEDLVMALGRSWVSSRLGAEISDDASEPLGPARKKSRTQESIRAYLRDKTDQVRYALANKQALKNLPQSLEQAQELLEILGSLRADAVDLSGVLAGRQTLSWHMLLLDMAVDRFIAEDLYQRRIHGSFAGLCLATDESPPSASRFRGLRFQVTCFYLGVIAPVGEWASCREPPIRTMEILGDICHCPGKRGEDVLRVLDKQLGRIGMARSDIVSGTGDGGGENEGKMGIHQALENLSGSYVRRRCLPHLAWRTADAAIAAYGEDASIYKTLASYLTDGVTWRRLRTLATASQDLGGLALFAESSEACRRIFGKSPSKITTQRPQSDMVFLQLLRGKEQILRQLCLVDVEDRNLAASTRAAVEDLGNARRNIERAILSEVLSRCMFLMHWGTCNGKIAGARSYESLMSEATGTIRDLSVADGLLERCGISDALWEQRGKPPSTWVEAFLWHLLQDESRVRDSLVESLDFHRRLTDRASAHLALAASNIMRTPWLAASLLDVEAVAAKAAAQALAQHLAGTPPASRTPFEHHLFSDEVLWPQIVDFSQSVPPVCLWQGGGAYESLFRFLAPRFLVAPDHILDCERQHARWQWLCALKRNLKMPAMNAFLRLTHFLERNGGEFPAHEALEEHLQAARLQLKWDLERIDAEEDMAAGWRFDMLWGDRLNLRAEDHRLLHESAGASRVPQDASGGYFVTWRTYCRNILAKGFWYKFSTRPSVVFYISENKTLAGREGRGEDEAVGRPLVLTFFEAAPGTENLFQRVDRSTSGMKPKLLTIAELLNTCGVWLEPDPERSSRDAEALLEDLFVAQGPRRMKGTLEPEAAEILCYTLADEVDAEEAYLTEAPPQSLTKIALARCLEIHLGEPRRQNYLLDRQALWERARAFLPHSQEPRASEAPLADPPADQTKGRGRGRQGKGTGGAGAKRRGRG